MRCIGVLLMLLAGCDVVFGIDAPSRADASSDNHPEAGDPACWSASAPGNEDGDSFSDGCDPCPADAEVGVIDEDGDGVGDACDPDPGSKQHTVAFDGFATNGAWMTSAGSTWFVVSSEYGPTPAAASATAELAIAATAAPVVDARLSVPGPCVGTNCGPGVYVLLDGHTVGCSYAYSSSGSDKVGIRIDKTLGQSVVPNPEGMPDRIVEIIGNDQSIDCRFYRMGRLTGMISGAAGVAPAATTTRIGLSADNAMVSFHSVSVLTTPP